MPDIEMDQLAEMVGPAIARNRVASQLTQEQVAESLGIGNEAVSRMDRGLVMPTAARLVELAEIFECDAADLLTEASTRTSDQAKYVGMWGSCWRSSAALTGRWSSRLLSVWLVALCDAEGTE